MEAENRCMACGTLGVEGGQICPVCRFANSTRTGDNDKASEQKKKDAEEHRKRILSAAQASVVGYQKQVVGNEIKLIGKKLIEFPKCSELRLGEVFWAEQLIAQDEKHFGKTWDMDLEIKISENSYRNQKVSVPMEAKAGAVRVGFSLEAGLKAKVHLMNTVTKSERSSGEIQLLGN